MEANVTTDNSTNCNENRSNCNKNKDSLSQNKQQILENKDEIECSDEELNTKMPRKQLNMQDHDKSMKNKVRRNRDLNGLEENKILRARLRSNSGRVYSSSLSVDAVTSAPSSPARSLSAVQEEGPDMCPKEDECCKGTTKLIEMMTKLQQSVDGALKKISTQEIISSNNSHKIQDLQETGDKVEQDIDSLGRELRETQFQLKVVSNIVIKQDQQIATLNQKITEMQQREMAPNVVISGIPESKQEKPMLLFNEFVQKGLEIQELIPANKAFRLGTGGNRPLLVELRHTEDKRKLFAKASKLKGKVNSKGGLYFLADHLPEELNENRRRINELVAENRKKPTGYQLEMNISRGRLNINDQQYEKAILPPTTREIIESDDKLFDKADELDIVKGEKAEQGKSRFVSYAVAVEDFNEIKAAYLKLRTKFSDATHVACAYRLPGANTPNNQDYIDDGEFGCGRTMLKVLKDKKHYNVATFMVRYYGGKHLGLTRYDIFRHLTSKAIENLLEKRAQEEQGIPPTSPLPDRFEMPQPEAPIVEEWHSEPGWSDDQHGNKQD